MSSVEGLTETGYRNGLLLLTLASVLIINLLPPLHYIFDRLYVFFHELGHVIALIFTGGQIQDFRVHPKNTEGQKGVTHPLGKKGDFFYVLPAGYLGTALLGAGLILLASQPTWATYALGILGAIIILLTLAFAYWRSVLALFLGLGFGALFIGVAWKADPVWSIYLLSLIGIQTGVAALIEYRELNQLARDPTRDDDDASKMSKLYGSTPVFWSTLWFLLSAAALGGAFWFTWLRNLTA